MLNPVRFRLLSGLTRASGAALYPPTTLSAGRHCAHQQLRTISCESARVKVNWVWFLWGRFDTLFYPLPLHHRAGNEMKTQLNADACGGLTRFTWFCSIIVAALRRAVIVSRTSVNERCYYCRIFGGGSPSTCRMFCFCWRRFRVYTGLSFDG